MIEFDGLAALDRGDLLRLTDLLEANILTPPLTALALREHVADAHADALAEWFVELARQGIPADRIVLMLRAFAAGRRVTADAAGPSVEVVVSGPDAARAARDTAVVMRQLFARARRRVLAVGFAVHQGKSVFGTLAERLDDDRSFEATLCIDVRRHPGDTSLDGEIARRFANEFVRDEWPGTRLPRVYYDPRSLEPASQTTSALHAKCVVIDGTEALVTSANFTEAAQQRNIELGLLLDAEPVARRIERHFISLIQNRFLERLPLP